MNELHIANDAYSQSALHALAPLDFTTLPLASAPKVLNFNSDRLESVIVRAICAKLIPFGTPRLVMIRGVFHRNCYNFRESIWLVIRT